MQTVRDRMRRSAGADDAGFTLIEVIVAMVIVALVMTSLSYAVVGSLKTIQQARQRQTATALATQQLERLRALPYDTVTQPGAGSTVKSGLLYTSTASGVSTFAPASSVLGGGVSETLVVNTVSGQWTDTVVDGVTYRVHTYVTKAPPTASGSQPFNLTVLVRWTSAVFPTARTTAERTTTFSPAGCLSTATAPFAAPCQAYLTVRSGEALGGVTVTDPVDSTHPIQGMAATALQLDFARASSTFLVEQTATGQAGASTSGASVTESTTTSTGGQAATAAVDSDPSSTPDQTLTATTPAHTAGTLQTSGTGGTLALRPSSSDTGTARAAVAADTSVCIDSTGSALTTGAAGARRPCSSSSVQPAGTSASLTYTAPDGTAVPLASFGTSGQPTRSVAAILGSANTGACTGSVVDCGHGAVQRTVGTSAMATAAFTAAPSGFSTANGLWSVSGLSETARAEEGAGAQAPVFTRAGTLRVWNGTGYTTVNLGSYAAPAAGGTPQSQSWAIPATAVDYGSVRVTYEGSVMVQRPSVTRAPATRTGTPATDCKTSACTTTVDGSAVVTSRVVATVSVGGTTLTSFAVVADLGGVTADASYKAAANG